MSIISSSGHIRPAHDHIRCTILLYTAVLDCRMLCNAVIHTGKCSAVIYGPMWFYWS